MSEPYREAPDVVTRIKRVGWAWPSASAVLGVCIAQIVLRLVGCQQAAEVREVEANRACHELVLDTLRSGDHACPHPSQHIEIDGTSAICRCPKPSPSVSP